MEKYKNLSKYLSFILRHKPDDIGMQIDSNGWCSIDDLLEKINKKGKVISIEILAEIVESDSKSRYLFNEDKSKIRANHSHSIEIDLGLSAIEPPDVLYHGTPVRFSGSIMADGLQKMKRHHVHLSEDIDTAKILGQRRGEFCVLKVDAKRMHKDGYKFYKSDNDVYLTDNVPISYVETIE